MIIDIFIRDMDGSFKDNAEKFGKIGILNYMKIKNFVNR